MHEIETAKIQTVTPATTEPVTVDDLMKQSYIDDDSQFDVLTRFIVTARQQYEIQARQTTITTVFNAFYNSFSENHRHYRHGPYGYFLEGFGYNAPCYTTLVLPRRPVQSVQSLTYIDPNGDTQTLTQGTDFTVDLYDVFAKLRPVNDKLWPATEFHTPNAVTVQFTAGFGTADDVPANIKSAILAHAANLYENREAAIVGQTVNSLPYSYDAILDANRTIEV